MDTIYEVGSATKYRRMPALKAGYIESAYVRGPYEQEVACSRRTGHILSVRGDRIVCRDCGATWKDEGF